MLCEVYALSKFEAETRNLTLGVKVITTARFSLHSSARSQHPELREPTRKTWWRINIYIHTARYSSAKTQRSSQANLERERQRNTLPIPCKKMNPVTIKTGCQLNSAAPPSQAKPSLKWRTHLSTNIMQTNPTAAAPDRTNTNCFTFSIAISVSCRGKRLDSSSC